MTGPTAAIACFGAAHVDRYAHARGPVVLGSSNPVSVSVSLGGVARNIAESLARLGCRVALVSRVGSDGDGDRVMDAMTGLGVDMDGTIRSRTDNTAGYTALLGPDGELSVGMADMAIYDGLAPKMLAEALGRLRGHTIWFADCNLPAESLDFLRREKPSGTTLSVDAVSVAKSSRLGADLQGIDLVFCNADEAAVLAGGRMPEADMAESIRRHGAAAVVVSLGAGGAVLAEAGGGAARPAFKAEIRDVTGAGDALVAGTLYGLSRGRGLLECLDLGLAAAALSVEDDRAVCDTLTPEALVARAGRPA